MVDFTHLHVHTQYSLLDGTAQIEPLLDTAKEKGFKGVMFWEYAGDTSNNDLCKVIREYF